MGKGGKGPGSEGAGGGGLSGSAMGLIALFVALALVFGGLAIGDRAGWFGEDTATSCDTLEGREVHEHAELLVYLDSDTAFDFSPQRYQVQEGFVHFEGGSSPPDRTVHVHEARPTLGCLFGTIGWTVGENKVTTDTGESYTTDEYDIRVLVDGEPAEDGFETKLFGEVTYEVHVEPQGAADDGGNESTNDSTSGTFVYDDR